MDTDKTKSKSIIMPFVLLQIGLFIFSLGGVCSKMAGRQSFLSFRFFLFYGLLIFILFLYALIWQQVLKSISLTVAYACKGIGIFYGILWGALLFGEEVRANLIVGALLVMTGSFFFLMDDAGRMKSAKEQQKDASGEGERHE